MTQGAGKDAARSGEGVRKLASAAWASPQRKQACALQAAKDAREDTGILSANYVTSTAMVRRGDLFQLACGLAYDTDIRKYN